MARKEANPQRKKERKRCNEQTQRKGEEGEETTLQLVNKDRAVIKSHTSLPPNQSLQRNTVLLFFLLVLTRLLARSKKYSNGLLFLCAAKAHNTPTRY